MVSTAFPKLSRRHAKVLAYWSYSMMIAESCGVILVYTTLLSNSNVRRAV